MIFVLRPLSPLQGRSFVQAAGRAQRREPPPGRPSMLWNDATLIISRASEERTNRKAHNSNAGKSHTWIGPFQVPLLDSIKT